VTQIPILLTTDDVAKATGRAKQTLVNDRHKGRGLPYVRIGSSIRYLMSDIENLIRQNRIVPRQSELDLQP
jgi:hypothetical protein